MDDSDGIIESAVMSVVCGFTRADEWEVRVARRT